MKFATPSPEPEPEPEREPDALQEVLRRKRERVKSTLLHIKYKSSRSQAFLDRVFSKIQIDNETDANFFSDLSDHLNDLCSEYNGSRSGQPRQFEKKGQKELYRWISERKGGWHTTFFFY